jgi:hypothetical protein
MKAFIALVLALGTVSVGADQVVYPPLTSDTIAGSWEALLPQQPPTLWHVEINKKGESYLAQITVGASCIIRRLVLSDVRDGQVKLHFDKASSHGVEFPELWIVGTGSGIESRGGIDAIVSDKRPDSTPPPSAVFGVPEGTHMFFTKGTWTRDLGEASKTAEKAIKEQSTEHQSTQQ